MGIIISSGLPSVAVVETTMEELLKKIPPEHRGVWFESAMMGLILNNPTAKLELAFTCEWAEENNKSKGKSVAESLLYSDGHGGINPNRDFIPRNAREKMVAFCAMATFANWLPTTCGCGFLRRSFERGGGSFSYKLPDTD